MVKFVPIFDSSVFIDVGNGSIGGGSWHRVKSRLPKHGSPLSFITLQELLIGLHKAPLEKFEQAKCAANEARVLCKRRVLDQPAAFLYKTLFRSPFGGAGVGGRDVRDWLEVACRAKEPLDLELGGVRYKRNVFGLDLSLLVRSKEDMRNSFVNAVMRQLDDANPEWRQMKRAGGTAVPAEMHDRIRRVDAETWKGKNAEALLHSLRVAADQETIRLVLSGVDALLTFMTSIVRDCLITTYDFERDANSFVDALQLYYLANDRFCIVTQDKGLLRRTEASSQRGKVLLFSSFLNLVS